MPFVIDAIIVDLRTRQVVRVEDLQGLFQPLHSFVDLKQMKEIALPHFYLVETITTRGLDEYVKGKRS